MGYHVLPLIQVFQKMLEILIEIYKEFLRQQYGSGCIIFWRLMKILWKDNMDQTVLPFMIFLPYTSLENCINSEI